MGLEFKVIASERKVLDKIVCDRCDKKIKKMSEAGWNPCGEPYSRFLEPHFTCFYHLHHNWGFDSRKDTETHEATLCEDCYDIVFRDVKIKITHYL